MQPNRRDFLKTSSLASLGVLAPATLVRAASIPAKRDGHSVLVVVQLSGGNDGINTVIPYRDPGYAKHRPELRLAEDRLLKLDDHFALHPALKPLMPLIEDHRLSIVQGVGYPNHDRSHFRSMAIWHHARRDPEDHDGVGWLGRALDRAPSRSNDAASLFVGGGVAPVAIRGSRAAASSIDRIEQFLLAKDADPRPLASPPADAGVTSFVHRSIIDACGTADRIAALTSADRDKALYPRIELARRLRLIAQLLKVDHGARVYYVRQAGYDTHAAQSGTHATLLSRLARSLAAFLTDLRTARLDDRVAVLVFSEFGRTVRENASRGTDHGTAGPVFVAGKNLRQPLVGTAPSLEDLEDGEPKVGIDFRRVYATLIRDVLGTAPEAVVGQATPLSLFRRG